MNEERKMEELENEDLENIAGGNLWDVLRKAKIEANRYPVTTIEQLEKQRKKIDEIMKEGTD